MDSILTSIKKLLGIAEEYTQFDNDIIIHINAVLMTLNQLGVGPEEGYFIGSKEDTWDEFISDERRLEMVKTYVYLKVRLLFDPPLSSSVIAAINESIKELEWRISVLVDQIKKEEEIQNGE